MPVRQGNQRETASQKGSDYSDAVIEFVEHRGYFLDSRAEDSGEGEDLVFIPKAGNRARIVAESKYRSSNKPGLSPNDYVVDFAERFYQWEEGAYRGYEFHLYTSKSSNPQLWTDLFGRVKDDEVESFFEKMKQKSKGETRVFLQKHKPSGFKRFLENSYIWIDYEIGDLKRINNRIGETGEYEYNPYSINYKAVGEPGNHKTNLLQVSKLPEQLYKIPATDGLTTRQFYSVKQHNVRPIHFHSNYIYSLIDPDELDPESSKMFDKEDYELLSFREFATDPPSEQEVNISKVLVRGVITTIANKVGAEVNRERRDTRIFMRHEGTGDLKSEGKWVAKTLDTGEVRHRSVVLFVKCFDNKYFVGLYPTEEFTKDGKKLVSGSRKKYLSDRFNPGNFPQNDRKSSTVKIWLSKLALEESLLRFELCTNLRDIQISRVDDLALEGARPPKTGDERNKLVQDQLTVVSDTEENYG